MNIRQHFAYPVPKMLSPLYNAELLSLDDSQLMIRLTSLAAKSDGWSAMLPLMSYTESSDMLPIRRRLDTRVPLVLAR